MDEGFSHFLEIMALVRGIQETNSKMTETVKTYSPMLFPFESESFAYARTWGDEVDQRIELDTLDSMPSSSENLRRSDCIEHYLIEQFANLSRLLEEGDRESCKYVQNAFATILCERCWAVKNSDPSLCINIPWENIAFEARWVPIPERLIEQLLAACDYRLKANLELTIADRNDSRDEWIYHEVLGGTHYEELKSRLRDMADAHDWSPVTTRQGIQKAAERFAERHKLPSPPPRKQGRP